MIKQSYPFLKLIAVHIFFLIFSILILFPVILDSHVIHASDLNGTDLKERYFHDLIYKQHVFPQWNPYLDQGIPSVADPLYKVYNPTVGIPVLLMPRIDEALKLIYIISVFIACETMFLLTKTFTRSPAISFLIALSYATCGYVAARIVAGHVEMIIPFGVLPLFFLFLWKVMSKDSFIWSILLAFVLTYIMFSGSMYFVLYSMYGILGISLYVLFKDKKVLIYICFSLILFILLSSIKLLPMLEVRNFTKTIEPYEGSQTLVSMVRYLFIPLNYPFQFFQLTRFISTAWGDLEKTAFIGPLSIIGIVWALKNYSRLDSNYKSFLIIMFSVFLLILMPAWQLNPFHWLIQSVSILQLFRVPSRSYAYFAVVILLIFGICSANLLKDKRFSKYIIPMLVGNLLLQIIFFEAMIIKPSLVAYDVPLLNFRLYEKIFSWIQLHNKSQSYILVENWISDVPSDVAYDYNQRLLNSINGFVLKDSPESHFENVIRATPYNYAYNYNDIQPGYFITPHNSIVDIPSYAKKVLTVDDTSLYELPNGRPLGVFEEFDGSIEPLHVTFRPNSFAITTNTPKLGTISIAEMNYPGWNVFIDGKKNNLEKDRFLKVQAKKGLHSYVFLFDSKPFRLGANITLVTLIATLSYIAFFLIKKLRVNL